MQIKKAVQVAFAAAIFLLPLSVHGQKSSINTFSPYTLYGVGDITQQGTAYMRSMGGAGIGYRDHTAINYLNPASISAMPRKAFIFNFGLEGKNTYLKSSDSKTSHNTFNIRDIAIQFPLAKGLAFGFSMTPYNSIGYRITRDETDDLILGQIGRVSYSYIGEGDITQFKAGLGWEVFKNFSIGAEAIYFLGDVERSYSAVFDVMTGTGSYTNTTLYQNTKVSRVSWSAGAQYDIVNNTVREITIGATYQPAVKLNPKVSTSAIGDYYVQQLLFDLNNNIGEQFELPHTIGLGAYYHNSKMSVGLDYSFQKWAGTNKESAIDNVTFKNTNTVRGGIQYTPSRYDVRKYMNRLTYRAGLRYSDYYMSFGGHSISDKAITAGVGIPITMAGLSNINIGLEFGQRGTTKHGLIKQNYFNFSIGLSLFGTDDWFKKYKYE